MSSLVLSIISIAIAMASIATIASSNETGEAFIGFTFTGGVIIWTLLSVASGITVFVLWIINLVRAAKVHDEVEDGTLLLIFCIFTFWFVDLIIIVTTLNKEKRKVQSNPSSQNNTNNSYTSFDSNNQNNNPHP